MYSASGKGVYPHRNIPKITDLVAGQRTGELPQQKIADGRQVCRDLCRIPVVDLLSDGRGEGDRHWTAQPPLLNLARSGGRQQLWRHNHLS